MSFAVKHTRALFALSAVLYPVAVVSLLPTFGPASLGLLLLGITGLRALALGPALQGGQKWLLGAAAGYGVALMLVDGAALALLYPSAVSAAVALSFAASAFAERTLIEQMAALAGDPVPPAARGYARVLNWVWAALLAVNAMVAAALAFAAPLAWWALYTGLLSYLLIGGFAALEYGYRQWYKRRLVAGVLGSDYDAGPFKP